MINKINEFNELIKEYNTIIVFRHLVGDGDALGSQWAMYYYLKEKYPQKDIYAVGDDTIGYENIFEKPHIINDDKFQGALGIVLDLANIARVSDDRVKMCDKIVKIDHHLDVDSYGDLEFVYPEVSSASQILANILEEMEAGKALDYKVAKSLYIGIISDTQSFSISSVDSKTFETATYLCKSNLNVGKITRQFNEMDLNTYKFRIEISNNIVFKDNGFAYVKIENADLIGFDITNSEAKRNVGLMKNITGINIWVLFIEDKDQPGIFDASLRSNEIVINDIAEKFGGGGHKFACGIKNLDNDTLNNLIKNLEAKL